MPTAVKGYTLIELLIVITIIGLMSVSAFVYSRSFSQDQQVLKSLDNIQTLIRTAQSNATSAYACGETKGASNWIIRFRSDNKSSIDLRCGNSAALIKNLTLVGVQVSSITGSSCLSAPQFSQDVNIEYAPLTGKVTFSGGDNCYGASSSLTVTLLSPDSGVTKTFTLTNGGAINAQ